jgi:pimeloyl-ACP methyl ester carboxylesterase
MPTALLNGIEIAYDVTGAGPAVLLSHGYSATRHMWDAQLAMLSDRYRTIAWDMRGHGETESPDDPAQYSAELTVADMRALLEHLGVRRAVIGGLSLGGYVSLAFALAHPAMVRALVICDSGPGYRNDQAREAWNRRAHERAVDLESRGLAALEGRSREMQEAVRHHASARGLAHAARGMLAQRGAHVIDGLPSIRVPTLVIVGDRDEPFLAPSRYIAAKIPGARLEIIEGAGHSANLDQPEAFNRVLRAFLDALPTEA